jgi:transcription elongation factor Elf1
MTMQITCPTCGHAMSVKDAKPGQYKPKCSKCGERFALTIFADARPPLVEALARVATAVAVPRSPVAEPAKQEQGTTRNGGTTLCVLP